MREKREKRNIFVAFADLSTRIYGFFFFFFVFFFLFFFESNPVTRKTRSSYSAITRLVKSPGETGAVAFEKARKKCEEASRMNVDPIVLLISLDPSPEI